jgi:ATP-dependent Clp protease ATP-binding subunit ClpA
LKRVIQKEIETPTARLILNGTLRDGFLLRIDWRDGTLAFDSHPVQQRVTAQAVGATP